MDAEIARAASAHYERFEQAVLMGNSHYRTLRERGPVSRGTLFQGAKGPAMVTADICRRCSRDPEFKREVLAGHGR